MPIQETEIQIEHDFFEARICLFAIFKQAVILLTVVAPLKESDASALFTFIAKDEPVVVQDFQLLASFLILLNVDASTLEEEPFHGDTEAEQREIATLFGDHIINVFCTIDGEQVREYGGLPREFTAIRFHRSDAVDFRRYRRIRNRSR